jgi:hypothetical protein
MDQHHLGSGRAASFTEGGSVGSGAKSHEAAEHIEDALVDQAEQVRHRAESAKEHAVERIRRVATQLRDVGDTLRTEDTLAAGVADRASRSIDGLANYVSDADTQSFVRDTEQLARREPAIFFGGAFLLGLAAGRFLKSSRPQVGLQADARTRRDPPRQHPEGRASYVALEPTLPTGGVEPKPAAVSCELRCEAPDTPSHIAAEREVEHAREAARDAEQKLSRVAAKAREGAGRELREAREFSRHAVETHPARSQARSPGRRSQRRRAGLDIHRQGNGARLEKHVGR